MKRTFLLFAVLSLCLNCGGNTSFVIDKPDTNNDPAYTLQSVYDKAPVF